MKDSKYLLKKIIFFKYLLIKIKTNINLDLIL